MCSVAILFCTLGAGCICSDVTRKTDSSTPLPIYASEGLLKRPDHKIVTSASVLSSLPGGIVDNQSPQVFEKGIELCSFENGGDYPSGRLRDA